MHLVDGGVADNLALRAGGAMMQTAGLSPADDTQSRYRSCATDSGAQHRRARRTGFLRRTAPGGWRPVLAVRPGLGRTDRSLQFRDADRRHRPGPWARSRHRPGALWRGKRDRWCEMRRRGRRTDPHIAGGDAGRTGEGSIAGDPNRTDSETAGRGSCWSRRASQRSPGRRSYRAFLANYPPQPVAAHSVAKATAQRAP